MSLVIVDDDRPLALPRNCPSAGTKSPLDSPCRYSSGSTSPIFGVLRAHGGRIAEREPLPLTGFRVNALVVNARRVHLDRARAGDHITRLVVTVAHHQPTPVVVALVGEPSDVGVDLGAQCLGQHPPRTLADDLIDHRRRRTGRQRSNRHGRQNQKLQ